MFNYASISFPIPGASLSEASFQLGLPDVLFFSLFLLVPLGVSLFVDEAPEGRFHSRVRDVCVRERVGQR